MNRCSCTVRYRMSPNLYIRILVCLAIANTRLSGETDTYGTINGVALQHVFKSTTARTVIHCCRACHLDATCLAVNYVATNGTCGLNNVHPSEASAQMALSSAHNVRFLKGCKRPWVPFQGHCYLYVAVQTTWPTGETHCVSLGAHLADVHSADETNFIVQTAPTKVWIGLDKYWLGEPRYWSTGALFTYANFASDQPNNLYGAENCVFARKSGEWNDNQCNETHKSICKKPFYMYYP